MDTRYNVIVQMVAYKMPPYKKLVWGFMPHTNHDI
jgi:hypothetical protein